MSDEKIDESDLNVDVNEAPLTLNDTGVDDEVEAAARPRGSAADDDDETWTNQPKDGAAADLSEEKDFLEEDEEEDAEQARAPRRVIKDGRDVVCEELPDRAGRAALRLKPFLTGAVVFEFTNSGERFLFDWSGEQPSAKPLAREVSVTCDESKGFVISSSAANVDTVIAISEAHLMAVRSGSLNPQVGMLTDKIRIKGKVGPAVYIFNLVAPRVRH